MLHAFRWAGAVIAALVLIAILLLAVLDWNWLRGPLSKRVSDATGRELVIEGSLDLKLGWPPRVRAEKVRFANPAWATQKQMFSVDAVEASIALWPLLTGRVFFPEVVLTRPVVSLEQSADGRKSWLLDRQQSEEGKGAAIGRLVLDEGSIGYDDARERTSVRSRISSREGGTQGQGGKEGIVFSVEGRFKGNALSAKGTGGPVLALRDDSAPYPLKVAGSLGKTALELDGTVTGLTTLSALDLKVGARGESLDQLFPVLGIALPATHPYRTSGRLVHKDKHWSYREFTARIGESDLGGTIEVATGGKRPFLRGDLVARLLDFDDLGPLIGTSPGGKPPPKRDRVLPEIPFNTDRWSTVDADVRLRAKAIRKAKTLPLDDFAVHLTMKDSRLTLDPLNFGVAGGQFLGSVSLDGRRKPIAADAKMEVRKVSLNKLMPTVDLNKKASFGRIDGLIEMKGNGQSVSQMLANANGKAALVVDGGQISNMMMEIVGIDLWEMLKFKVQGDQPVAIRCAVFDAGVKEGTMSTNLLVLDTDDTKVVGSGTLDLAKEQLDMKLDPQPKDRSLISLRTPIHLRGPLGKPDIGPDKRKLAIRGLGALAAGAVAPPLAVLPLVETGPGLDSDCGQLIQAAKKTERKPVPSPKR